MTHLELPLLERKKPTALDQAVFILLLLWAFLWTTGIIKTVSDGEKRLVVKQGNRMIYDGSADLEPPRLVTVKGDGFTMRIKVDVKGVKILPMDKGECPKAICSRLAPISKPGEALFCLPNKVAVSIVSASGDVPIDAIAR